MIFQLHIHYLVMEIHYFEFGSTGINYTPIKYKKNVIVPATPPASFENNNADVSVIDSIKHVLSIECLSSYSVY